MVEIPQRSPTPQDIWDWHQLQQQIKKLQEQETLMRRFIAKGMFADLTEGTETKPLGDGWVLKCAAKVNRTLDEAVLTANTEKWHNEGVPLAKLIQHAPKLVMKEYRKLPNDLAIIFDDCITTKPGMPTLELIAPKPAEE